jgi:short-subunit dehydrogenase
MAVTDMKLETTVQSKWLDQIFQTNMHELITQCESKLKEVGVKTFELDYTDEDSIKAAARNFGDIPLDVLINCGGQPHAIVPPFWQTAGILS